MLAGFEPIAIEYDGSTEVEEAYLREAAKGGGAAAGGAQAGEREGLISHHLSRNDLEAEDDLRIACSNPAASVSTSAASILGTPRLAYRGDGLAIPPPSISSHAEVASYSSLEDSASSTLSLPLSDSTLAPSPSVRLGWQDKSWSERFRYISYYLPILKWLPEYNFRESLMYDLVAGLTVGAMIIPQSIAYASLVNLSPLQGLGTAFLAKIVYLIFGTNRIMSMGPEATTAILLGHTISTQSDVQDAVRRGDNQAVLSLSTEYACVITLMCGVLTLVFGLLRLGFVDTVFSRPVLSGFIFGVGSLLIIEQFPKLVGAPSCTSTDCDETIGKLKHIGKVIFGQGDVNWRTILISVCAVSFLFGFAWLKKRYSNNKKLQLVPQVFILVFVVTLISYCANLKQYGVAVLGHQEKGFPTPQVPKVSGSRISNLFSSAITLAILGFIETQLVSKTIPSGSVVSPNRELVALGAMHIVASFFSCWSAYGSLTRTRVSVQAGARSPITALIAAIILLFTMTLIIPVFEHMPACVTASIIFYVGTTLLETHELKFTYKMKQWLDFALNAIMIVITIFLGVDTALFFAFAACLLIVIKNQNKPSMRLMGRLHERKGPFAPEADAQGYFEVEESADVHTVELQGILIYQIDGPLFFSNAEGLKERTRRIEFFGSVRSHPSEPERPLALRGIIFDLTAVTMIDATAASVLLEIIADYKHRNVRVAFVKLRKNLYKPFERAGLIEAIGGEQNLFRTIDQAMASLQQSLNEVAADQNSNSVLTKEV